MSKIQEQLVVLLAIVDISLFAFDLFLYGSIFL